MFFRGLKTNKMNKSKVRELKWNLKKLRVLVLHFTLTITIIIIEFFLDSFSILFPCITQYETLLTRVCLTISFLHVSLCLIVGHKQVLIDPSCLWSFCSLTCHLWAFGTPSTRILCQLYTLVHGNLMPNR